MHSSGADRRRDTASLRQRAIYFFVAGGVGSSFMLPPFASVIFLRSPYSTRRGARYGFFADAAGACDEGGSTERDGFRMVSLSSLMIADEFSEPELECEQRGEAPTRRARRGLVQRRGHQSKALD